MRRTPLSHCLLPGAPESDQYRSSRLEENPAIRETPGTKLFGRQRPGLKAKRTEEFENRLLRPTNSLEAVY